MPTACRWPPGQHLRPGAIRGMRASFIRRNAPTPDAPTGGLLSQQAVDEAIDDD